MHPQKHIPFQWKDALTIEQLQYFNTHGVLHIKQFISPATVAAFLDEIQLLERFVLNNPAGEVSRGIFKNGHDETGYPVVHKMTYSSKHSRLFSDFLKEASTKALLQLSGKYPSRIDESINDELLIQHYLNTGMSNLKELGWHTDIAASLLTGARLRPVLKMGIHLDHCPFELGGLRVLAGTHTQELSQLLFRKRYFSDTSPDPEESGFDIEPGDLTVHDGRLWHHVQKSIREGAVSRRRVVYIPSVTDAFVPATSSRFSAAI
jgi:hypothetical protein